MVYVMNSTSIFAFSSAAHMAGSRVSLNNIESHDMWLLLAQALDVSTLCGIGQASQHLSSAARIMWPVLLHRDHLDHVITSEHALERHAKAKFKSECKRRLLANGLTVKNNLLGLEDLSFFVRFYSLIHNEIVWEGNLHGHWGEHHYGEITWKKRHHLTTLYSMS